MGVTYGKITQFSFENAYIWGLTMLCELEQVISALETQFLHLFSKDNNIILYHLRLQKEIRISKVGN